MTETDDDARIVELRRYTLHPGRRDELITLFDTEFVESQEALGLRVLGQFRDLDAPDHLVWLRGFSGMAARRQGLAAFYGGPVWARHGAAANATMVDSDDVHLLQPAWAGAGLQAPATRRAAPGATACPPGRLDLALCALEAPADEALRQAVRLHAGRAGRGALVAAYVTEPSRNDFPRLPVHEGRPVLALLFAQADVAAPPALSPDDPWQAALLPYPPAVARLVPTARSAWHL